MIDYGLLHQSTLFYEASGYARIESPWLVSEAVSDVTRPLNAMQNFVFKGGKKKCFVASGEQSFLYLILKGYLAPGRYQTITPCLRNDDFGPHHTKYFMKNELIDTRDVSERALESMVATAETFFRTLIHESSKLEVIDTSRVTGEEASLDIELNGIEVGSYGIRETTFARWVYGTGLALPRFSSASRVPRPVYPEG